MPRSLLAALFGCLAFSGSTAAQDTTPPSAPTGLRVTTNSCSLALFSWLGSFDNTGGSGLKGYKVYYNGALLRQVLAPTNWTVITGLRAGAANTFAVSAFDVAGNQSAQSSIVGRAPACANQPPIASAGPDQTNRTGVAVAFNGAGSRDPDGTLRSYIWYFGDGSSAVGMNVTHAFAAAGTYNVTLTVSDNAGAMSSDSALVVITSSNLPNQPPVANAGADQTGTVGVALSFDASGSRDSDGSIQTYAWNFGNGATAYGRNVSYAYASAGTFTVTLTVTDNAGARSTDTAVVTVNPANNQSPIANAGPDKTNTVGAAVSFSASSSRDPDGTITSYAWEFGNGATGAGVNVAHAYPAAGTYTARLRVTDNSGATATDTAVITIKSAANVPPIANAGPDVSGVVGTALAFSAAASRDSDGSISSYVWNFGDGATGSGSSVSHAYASSGTFTASVTVTDNAGASATDNLIVTVSAAENQPPVAKAGPDRSARVGVALTFDGSASLDPDGSIRSYLWTFGDGASASGVSVAHSYGSAGTFSATLRIEDNGGATATDTVSVHVESGGGGSGGQFVDAIGFGGANADRGQAIAVDKGGNVVLGGFAWSRPFLAKFSPDNTLLWTLGTEGVGSGSVQGVATDREGNVLVTGNLTGTLDFGGGPLTSVGGHDIFVAKFSAAGGHIWSKRFGGTTLDGFMTESGFGIASDPISGDVVVTGIFDEVVNFGGGPLYTVSPQCMFLARFSASGSHRWSRKIGGDGATLGSSVAIDQSGNAFVTGSINAYADFGGVGFSSIGTFDMFLAKYNPSGGCVWVKSFGTMTPFPSTSVGTSVALDSTGGVVVAGDFNASQTFGGPVLLNSGYKDSFLAKYSAADGGHVWSKRFGGIGQDVTKGVTVDDAGNITLLGQMQTALDFGGGAVPVVAGQVNMFLANFSSGGAHRWSSGIALGRIGDARAVASGPGRGCVGTGSFGPNVTFGGQTLSSAGNTDVFVAEFGP